MRIIMVGKYYPPYKGGMETVLRDLCEGLLDRGCAVRAIVAGTEAEDSFERLGDGDGEDVRDGRLIRCARFGRLLSQPITPTLPLHLRRAFSEFAPDVVMVHLPNPLAAACLLELRLGWPRGVLSTCWYHADITRQRLGRRLVSPLIRSYLSRCDGIACSSRELVEHSPLLAAHDHRLRVIPFGLSPDRWSCPDRSPGDDSAFLFVGRLVYYKGLLTLLEAMAGLPEGRLDIVGDGPLREEIAARAARPDLTGRVRLLGELTDERLRDVMAGSRALVLPSDRTSETFGLVQLEAMVAGLPVVSCRLPTGVAGVNRHRETGLIIPPGDAPALREALAEILADPRQARRWGSAGKERVAARFHRDRMVSSLLDWFGELRDVARTTRGLGVGF